MIYYLLDPCAAQRDLVKQQHKQMSVSDENEHIYVPIHVKNVRITSIAVEHINFQVAIGHSVAELADYPE
jgi:hypothetical protein